MQKLLDVVKEGDVIVTTEVSRLTRSTKHLCEILQIVQEKKLILDIGGSFRVDCSKGEMDPMTEGMVKMWGVFTEMERNIMSQRVKSGILNAKAKGKHIGRPRVTVDKIPSKFMKYYPAYKSGSLNITNMSKILECSRATIYKYISMLESADKRSE